MTLALTFATPLLLVGLAAAGIPVVLHLLSRVTAQPLGFPTLRFLRAIARKTARRRKIRDLLLLAARALLLGILAVAAAEPISRRAAGWLGRGQDAAVIVLDNSMSMAAKAGAGSRFAAAKSQAIALLAGPEKPDVAAVLTSCGRQVGEDLTAQLDQLRAEVHEAVIAYAPTSLSQQIAAAAQLLGGQSLPRQSIYLFSDLQRNSFQQLIEDLTQEDVKNVRLLVVDTGGEQTDDVAVSGISISAAPIVGRPLVISARVVNSSPAQRVVELLLRLDGQTAGHPTRKVLAPAGQPGSSAEIGLHHCFDRPGYVAGQVVLVRQDDLAEDNVRRFALQVGPKIRALVVSGPSQPDQPPGAGPADMLLVALNPYDADATEWPVSPVAIEAGKVSAADLQDADIAFFCEVPSFTSQQAGAIAEFVSLGGSAVFFLGEGVNGANYNELLTGPSDADGGLLGMKLVDVTGQIGPTAGATPLASVDLEHEYLAGLYDSVEDYLTVRVQRYFRLSNATGPAKTLMTLAGGDPLLVEKAFGRGRVVLFATASSPRWSNLPATGLFLPLVVRMSLASRQGGQWNRTYTAGSKVTLVLTGDPTRPPGSLSVMIATPSGQGQDGPVLEVPAVKGTDGCVVEFDRTDQPGFYRWHPAHLPEEQRGVFAANPCGKECELAPMSAEALRSALAAKGIENVFVASTLGQVYAQAADAAQGRNWWDVLVAAAICLMVLELIVANRRPGGRQAGRASAVNGLAGVPTG